ncbi:S8 family serine peptidase [Candidatus Peregrinibacteria bacterium]|nr:S8 family serine peptidase [Candidatus Peregrinibacteria bacterium]
MMQRTMLTWTLGIVAAAAITGGAAQLLPGQNVHSIAVRKEDLRSIPTCKELGRCKGEQHLILKSKSERTIGRLVKGGCKVRHRMNDQTSLRCPEGRTYTGLRSERFFRSQDLFSAEQMGAVAVHAAGVTGQGVKIAILDSGVESDHPELAGKILAYRNFTDDGPEDAMGHGTHVAGIAMGNGVREVDDGGRANRVLGVAPDAALIVAKVCGNDGWCAEGAIMEAIEWAAAQGADVMNLSLGGGAFLDHCDGDPLAAKLNWAVDQGVTVVAASGNGGELGEGVSVPACGSKVIAVGAVDASDTVQPWSSYGRPLDLVAPGVAILSSLSCQSVQTCPEAGYGKASGTSMAAPHVAGAAALLLQADPTMTPLQVYGVLTDTAKDLGIAGFDAKSGFGRVDIDAAVMLVHDRDHDGFTAPEDCNDGDGAVYPGRGELCNGKDDNCDGRIDEGWDQDADSVTSCGGDCNDADPLISPKAQEMCNGKDDNCNKIVDENCPISGKVPGSSSSASSSSRQGEGAVGARVRVEVSIRVAKEAYVRAWTKIDAETRAGKTVDDEAKLLLSDAYSLVLRVEDAFLSGDLEKAFDLAEEAKQKANDAQSGHHFREKPREESSGNTQHDKQGQKGDGDLSDGVSVRGEAQGETGAGGVKAKVEAKIEGKEERGRGRGKGR